MVRLLGCDVGTGGTKAVLLDEGGRLVGAVFEAHPVAFPRPLWVEQDPEEWWASTGRAVRRLLRETGTDPTGVGALAFSSQLVNCLLLDGRGRPLRPCLSWMDGRAGAEAGRVMARLGGGRLFALLAGARITGKDLLPKYLWLRRREPENWEAAAAVVDAGGYLLARTTGRLRYEWTQAAVTGLFDLGTKRWNRLYFRLFGLDGRKFPPLVRPVEKVGGLLPEAADHLGLLPETPVFAGAGDAPSAAVGAGAGEEGAAHLCLGTSGFVGVVTRRRVRGRHGIVTIQSADPDLLLLIAETESSGACVKWAVEALLGLPPGPEAYARLDAEASKAPPGCDGLLFAPWLSGERAPVADEALRACFLNLSGVHGRAHLCRAILEGVAYTLRWLFEILASDFGCPCPTVRVLGGGARSEFWLSLVAGITGRRLERVPHPQEAGAAGAALLAGTGLGIWPTVAAAGRTVVPDVVFEPERHAHPAYRRMYGEFRRISDGLSGLYRRWNGPRGVLRRDAP